MKISFGIIFSIILIIIFLSVAIFGIKKFVGLQDTMKSEKIFYDLQQDIDKMWQSSRGAEKVSYRVPKKAEALCFQEQIEGSEEYNAYFIPREFEGEILNHIEWSQVKRHPHYQEEGLCFGVEYAKVTLMLEKDYEEEGVTITKVREE